MNNQNGNILIYILGAIFLLGLLVVMVKGSSTPGSNIDRETLLIRVAEVQAYGQELERAVAYIRRNGHSETDIRFAHPDADPAYGDITDTPSRQVFAVQGGGAKYREPPEDIQVTTTDWYFTAANSVGTIGSGFSASNSETELLVMLNDVTKEFCLALNNQANIENPSGNPPEDGAGMVGGNLIYTFIGDYSFSAVIDNPVINNSNEACVQRSTGTYHYYRVLLAR